MVYREAEGQPERNVFVEIGATVAEGVEVQGLEAGGCADALGVCR